MSRSSRVAALKGYRQRKALAGLLVLAMLAGGSALAWAKPKAQPIAAGAVKSASGVQTSYKVYEGTDGGHVKMVLPASIFDETAKGNVLVKFDTSECVIHDGGFVMAVGRQTSYKGIDGFDAPYYALVLVDGDPDVRLTSAEDEFGADYLCNEIGSLQDLVDLLALFDVELDDFAVVNGIVRVR